MSAVTLFVSNLPATASSDHLESLFSEVGPVKRCFVVRDKGSEKCRGIGYVTYAMQEDAQRALKDINKYDGHKISVVLAQKKVYDKKRRKGQKDQQETESPKEAPEKKSHQKAKGLRKKKMKARLIIRNLSFKCSEADLKETFSKFGTVLDVNIPLKPDGKKRGFAFVQFKNMLEAGKALTEMNLKNIKDRQVAVDWAVSKDKFVTTQLGAASASKKDENENLKEAEDGEDSEEEDEPPAKKSKAQQEENEHSESLSDDDDDVDDDDEDHHKDSEDEEDGDDSQEADSDDSCPASDDDDENDEDDDDDDDESAQQKKKKVKNPLPSDVNEGKTVFLRNLSFDSEEEGIEEILLQFGELNYIRVVLHPETGHSKGCAFAQFKSKEAAEKCLAAAQNDEAGGVRVDGRKLNIVLAVTRDDAAKLKTKKVKTHKGSRNLYLAREGLIRAGTKSAEGVSDADMAKRMRFEELKRAKLKDVSVFVSRTRLCVHNLPKNVDRQRLFQLCLSAAGGTKQVRITECHVMYDKKPVRGQVMGKSLGYGFVEFKEHEHALQALRHLNNNPNIFGANKRPIVEFSLEDSRKLKLKAMRLQKSKTKADSDSRTEKNQSQKAKVQERGSKPSQQKSPGKGKAVTQQAGEVKTTSKDKKGGQRGHYSGFRTTPEVEHVELEDGKKRQKVLPMPSHRGPKIRHRDKGKQPVQSKKVKKGPSRKDRNVPSSMEKPNQNKKQSAKPVKKKFRNKDNDRFDSLVEQYKKKLMGAPSSKGSLVKKSKWFS